MIDSSSNYGLYNPCFSDDIGRIMLNQYLGSPGMDIDDFRLGTGTYGYTIPPNSNGLTQDTVEISGKEPKKKKSVWKKILIGAGIITGAVLLLKFGKKGFGKIKTGITNLINKIKKPKPTPTTTP